jgi:hypothetical protein
MIKYCDEEAFNIYNLFYFPLVLILEYSDETKILHRLDLVIFVFFSAGNSL